ncbi:hypothetical protein PR048_024927 [Dryococelus australis]|uniref:PiggyBac transposable element-derived protein domain-containing protein n=1 Tax=Dryococelus australis TaxID=614101 RepID=A0ABQ9GQ14_9NEOP|nr:hypothetical protein PR048_024927 [Dryococelus australis]
MLVDQTKRYDARKNRIRDVRDNAIKCFIGILLLSGYVSVSRRRIFWEDSKYCFNELVASSLSRDRFEFIMTNLYCCDNENLDDADRVDEAIVPDFSRHGCKQFIMGNSIRLRYKLWVVATDKEYVVWMEPYQSAKSKISDKYKRFGVGRYVVLEHKDILLSLGNFSCHVSLDNYFTTVSLLKELTKRRLKYTGIIRENRSSEYPLSSKAVMKKKERGANESRHEMLHPWNPFTMCHVSHKKERKESLFRTPVRSTNTTNVWVALITVIKTLAFTVLQLEGKSGISLFSAMHLILLYRIHGILTNYKEGNYIS